MDNTKFRDATIHITFQIDKTQKLDELDNVVDQIYNEAVAILRNKNMDHSTSMEFVV